VSPTSTEQNRGSSSNGIRREITSVAYLDYGVEFVGDEDGLGDGLSVRDGDGLGDGAGDALGVDCWISFAHLYRSK
jgi:hypothetical protein